MDRRNLEAPNYSVIFSFIDDSDVPREPLTPGLNSSQAALDQSMLSSGAQDASVLTGTGSLRKPRQRSSKPPVISIMDDRLSTRHHVTGKASPRSRDPFNNNFNAGADLNSGSSRILASGGGFHEPSQSTGVFSGGLRPGDSLASAGRPYSRKHTSMRGPPVDLGVQDPDDYSSFAPDEMHTADDRLGALWLCWVLVIGVSSDAYSINSILSSFQEFGDIVDHAQSGGNWLFIKYSSPSQASRATLKSSRMLNGKTLLSVQLMNSEIASSLNIRIQVDGSIDLGDDGLPVGLRQRRDPSVQDPYQRTKVGQLGTGYRTIIDPGNADVYLRPPKKNSNICTKIMQFFFSF